MYRQILIDPRDRDYLRILWRNSPSEPIEDYQLRTVTYGTTLAPYLALRVLKQLVEDEGSKFPAAVSVIREQTYVDDFLFGGDTPASIRQIRDQTNNLLSVAGISLRKWASNEVSLLSHINPDNHGLAISKSLESEETISILGLIWSPVHDHFQFRVSVPPASHSTKRAILSSIAKLFDPMGWIAPVVICAKILIQQLRLLRCGWDDALPNTVLTEWHKFRSQLPELEGISIPRKISPNLIKSQSLHGFSDASTKAYAAAVYSRCVLRDGSIHVNLLIAKSRVAPVKKISVPRLELCAALLLARLVHFIRTALNAPSLECHCWTDSSITLTWLTQSPSRWKTFAANRVTKITELLPTMQWHHVPTNDNPADCASRGMSVSQIQAYSLWWCGPQWLQGTPEDWPREFIPSCAEASQEERSTKATCVLTSSESWSLHSQYSSWPKLLRVTAYTMRFVSNIREKIKFKQTKALTASTPRIECSSTVLQPSEIKQAKLFWLKQIQRDTLSDDLKCISSSKPFPKSSPIISLAPYLDQDGLLCARGRLAKSQLPESVKTPIILRSHPLVTLLIQYTHAKLLHAAPQLTLASLRTEYWILRARTTVRAVLHRCVAGARERASIQNELMGDLPAPRVTPSERPYIHTGVDYAGPIQVRATSGRGRQSHKAYIAVFVCLTVKAIHIELVNDLSSAAFLAAYHRFSSHRGLPKAMYSDNGTTFHGANREIVTAYQAATHDADFRYRLATDGVEWHFMPPNTPHFGGLWEAAVKSIKHHLKRSIGSYTLTHEEMTTFLCRVEACVNSRRIGTVSDCLDDYVALTPGHFLIGNAIVTQPEPSVLNLRDNRLSLWQIVQKMTETFWKAWGNDY